MIRPASGRAGHRRSAAAFAALSIAVLATIGCSAREEVGEAPTTTTFVVETDEGSQSFRADGEEGTFSFEGDDGRGELTFDLDGDGVIAQGEGGSFELSPGTPAGWPAAFPVPPGAEVVGGNIVEAGPLRQLTTVYLLPTPGADVVRFYEDALADDHPLVDVRDERPESFQASVSFEGEHVGFATLTTLLGGTELAVQLVIEQE